MPEALHPIRPPSAAAPPEEAELRILGIDPGLGKTGYAVLSVAERNAEPALLEAGVIRSPESAPLEERLRELHRDLSEIIRQFRPGVMAIENLYSHYNHPRTSIVMGHARGVIFLAAAQAEIPVRSYAATEIKKSLLGTGRATKAQMQQMVQKRLGLPALPEPPDVADAAAAAYCHLERAVRRGRARALRGAAAAAGEGGAG